MRGFTDTINLFIIAAGQAACGAGQNCDTGLPVVRTGTGQLQTVLQVIFAIAAALAVLMIVVAGFRFITAQGNSQEVGKAKATIIYALVGLLVAITAQAIVALTLDNL